FDDVDTVRALMVKDLSVAAGQQVAVELYDLESQRSQALAGLEGENIDAQDVEIDCYEPAPELLRCISDEDEMVTETLVSDLLKSNCPVTGQPDWGSVQVSY